MSYFPIIYVRGYAMTEADIEETVDDPFYGFNVGSTHYRIDQDGAATFFAFESPFVRLSSDHRYSDAFFGSKQTVAPMDSSEGKQRSIWIHRYYDETSRTFDDRVGGRRLSIEEAAWDLNKLIQQVITETNSQKVVLVAHSMGGLVCRCLLQKIYPESGERGSKYIDKFVTFGTPHGGISFRSGLSLVERARDFLSIADSDNFGRARMYEFLVPSGNRKNNPLGNFEANLMPEDAFPSERVLCIVGTNSRDYEVAHGFSRFSVGPQSDGLVQVRNASLQKSHRAYIHRCHSGRFGMVNSEEGYQNLRRFLFGDVKVEATLCDFELKFDTANERLQRAYHIELHVAVRSLPMLLHERTLPHFCPVTLNEAEYRQQKAKGGLPLFTNFLLDCNDPGSTEQFVFRLAVHSQLYENGVPVMQGHMERLPIWSDYLVVELKKAELDAPVFYYASYRWSSESESAMRVLELKRIDDTRYDADVPLPERSYEALGKSVHIHFATSDWS